MVYKTSKRMKKSYGEKKKEKIPSELSMNLKIESMYQTDVHSTVLHLNEIRQFYLNFDRVEFVVRR